MSDVEHAHRCANLLKRVLVQAAHDLATPLMRNELALQQNRQVHARQSLYFFFAKRSPLGLYADALGLDADDLRAGVQNRTGAESAGFREAERRVVARRVSWWLAEHRSGEPEVPATVSDDETDADEGVTHAATR